MTTALFIGRFQPFHIGHLSTIEYVMNKVDKLIIGVGSSQENGTYRNPFSAEERMEMIRLSLEVNPEKYVIIPIPDVNNDELWVKHVRGRVPAFEIVYTSSELERKLFEREGFRVHIAPLFDKDRFSATNIRDRIRIGKEWRHLVPRGTIEVMERINGEKRLKELG